MSSRHLAVIRKGDASAVERILFTFLTHHFVGDMIAYTAVETVVNKANHVVTVVTIKHGRGDDFEAAMKSGAAGDNLFRENEAVDFSCKGFHMVRGVSGAVTLHISYILVK